MSVFFSGYLQTAHAQADELAQLALNIQKLNQFRTILADMKKGYQIISKGYTTVKNLSEGNFSLHETFLNGLLSVSPTVAKYKRIPEIIRIQKDLLSEYRNAVRNFKMMSVFSGAEIASMEKVYQGIFAGTVENIDELILVVTGGKLRMGDAERLAAVDRIYFSMKEKSTFLHYYNFNNYTLGRQRQSQLDDVNRLSHLFGK
ncbi:TerB family tellurite resistance protein [Chitinophaga varians]|nr:TerB family tellurite resistance protein [Chitinophaga varians]